MYDDKVVPDGACSQGVATQTRKAVAPLVDPDQEEASCWRTDPTSGGQRDRELPIPVGNTACRWSRKKTGGSSYVLLDALSGRRLLMAASTRQSSLRSCDQPTGMQSERGNGCRSASVSNLFLRCNCLRAAACSPCWFGLVVQMVQKRKLAANDEDDTANDHGMKRPYFRRNICRSGDKDLVGFQLFRWFTFNH